MSETWLERSARISMALMPTRGVGKLLQIERVAAENGLSPQTVHHLLRAHGFLERIRREDKEISALLAALPYQAVMAAERWHARDRDGLLTYMRSVSKPSVRQLTKAELQSRDVPRKTSAKDAVAIMRSAPRAAAGPELETLMDWTGIKPFELSTVAWEPENGDYERALGIEFRGLTPERGKVALVVGPDSETSGHYTRQAKPIWFTAVSAASLFQVVIMLLPTRAAQRACLTSMPLPPSGDHGWPRWNRHGWGRGQPRSGPVRPATPEGGIVLFTTPDSLVADWQS